MQGIFLRKYGVQTTINFHLFEIDGVNFRVDAADGGTDCSIMKDEGAEATCTNDFTDEGTGYSLVLTATEMQAARIVVYVVDTVTKVWLDTAIVIETYGHASAMHAFDLDTASTAQTGDSYARLGTPAGASIAADLLVIDNFVDELETRLSAARAGYLDNLSAGAVALASICTEARLAELASANIPADIDTLLSRITAAVALASVCTEARLAELDAANIPTDLTTITAYVDELETRLTAARAGYLDELGPANIPADIDTLLTRITAAVALASICTEPRLAELDAANLPADIAGLNNISVADVNAQVLDVMNVDTFAEPGQGAAPATTSIFAKINYLYKVWRNKKDNDGSTRNIYDDAGTTVDQKSTVSEAAGTVTVGKIESGP